MSEIITTDDEVDYLEEDIVKICKEYSDFNIDDILFQREKKERKKIYEKTSDANLIFDTKIGKNIIEKYNLAIKEEIPIEFIYEDVISKLLFTVKDRLKDNKNIEDELLLFRKEYKITINSFVLGYYIANRGKRDAFMIENLNKLKKITSIEYDKDLWSTTKDSLGNFYAQRMEFTKKKAEKIKKFYKEINDLEYSNSPKNINESLELNNTKIEIDIMIKKYYSDIDNGAIIFNDIRATEKFPYIQYNSFDDKFYKIYDKVSIIKETIPEKNNIFENLEEEDQEKPNHIYIIMKLERLSLKKSYFILLDFNLETSKLTFEYPSDSLEIILDEINYLIEGIQYRKKKTISVTGNFEMSIENFEDLKLYYLTHFDEKIMNFLYVMENKSPRSLKKNVKYYYKSYDENIISGDYSLTFHLEQIYTNKWLVVFRSKVLGEGDSINEFALVFSKLMQYYQTYSFQESDIPLIKNPYTGKDGNGLGDNFDESTANNLMIKGKKLANLKSIAPEIFPSYDYGRSCPCPKQPIIIDEEDVPNWEKYGREVSVFPPVKSAEKVRKRYNFVCPTDNAIMNYILNPEDNSPFPILPCCAQQQTNNYYENYDEIKANPDKFLIEKDELKLKVNKGKRKGVNPLSLDQEGSVPENLEQFLAKIYPNTSFSRIGVARYSKSGFLHCCLIAAEHLGRMKDKIANQDYINNIRLLDKIRSKYINSDIIAREEIINRIRGFIGDRYLKINLEIMSQEMYDYDKYQLMDTLENKNIHFDSKLFYKLMEYLFFMNIFVFEFKNGQLKLEKPNHIHYHQREYREGMVNIIIFKNNNSNPPVYELIKEDSNNILMFNDKLLNFMRDYILEKGYYICRALDKGYEVTKNTFNNVNWNYLLKDYKIIGQYINDSGRAFGLNVQFSPDENDIMTIFIEPSFPLDVPVTKMVYEVSQGMAEKLFGKKHTRGSQGLWYCINSNPQSVFIPCYDIPVKKSLICREYIVSIYKSKQMVKFRKLNIIKKNASIITQIILWLWNIAEEETLEDWFETYVTLVDKKNISMNMNMNAPLNIELRFPLNTKNTLEGIEYYSDFLPSIFAKNQIFLYQELAVRLKQFLVNFITRTDGYGKIPNRAIVNIFQNEVDFDKKTTNKIIIGEENYDDWVNFIDNLDNDYSIIEDDYINQKRGFLYKDKNGHIYMVQNNINNSLEVAILMSKVWRQLKINLGYHTTLTNIWQCIKCDCRLYDVFKMSGQDLIELTKKYYRGPVDNIDQALEILEREKIDYELKKEDYNYIALNSEEFSDKEYLVDSDPYRVFSYANGGYAAMLNIL